MTRERKKAPRAARKGGKPAANARPVAARTRARAGARARDSDLHYRDLVEASSDWIWEMDADLRFTYFSKSLTSRFDIDPAKVIGRTR